MESPAHTQRKLAAIMFTDIVDYSAMADKNEKNALELLKTHNDLLREEFSKFNGNEIKNTGDGFLVKFSNTLDSVKSAISIQKSLDLYNTTKDKNEQINIRIGLHLGDVEESEDDVHGDGCFHVGLGDCGGDAQRQRRIETFAGGPSRGNGIAA